MSFETANKGFNSKSISNAAVKRRAKMKKKKMYFYLLILVLTIPIGKLYE
jgi:hypothetical protein